MESVIDGFKLINLLWEGTSNKESETLHHKIIPKCVFLEVVSISQGK